MSGPLASYTGLAALRRALDTRDVSATELARASLAAAQARDDLNAFVHIDEDLTLAQARHADAMIEAGTAGPLTGIPIAHKDVFVTQGWRSTRRPELSLINKHGREYRNSSRSSC